MLGSYGVRVLRFDADAVMDEIDQVVEFIDGVSSGKILPEVDADGSASFPRFRGKGQGGPRADGGLNNPKIFVARGIFVLPGVLSRW